MSAKIVELEERLAKLEAIILPKDADPAKKGRKKVAAKTTNDDHEPSGPAKEGGEE